MFLSWLAPKIWHFTICGHFNGGHLGFQQFWEISPSQIFSTCEIVSPKLKTTSLHRWWLHWFERIHWVGFYLGRCIFLYFGIILVTSLDLTHSLAGAQTIFLLDGNDWRVELYWETFSNNFGDYPAFFECQWCIFVQFCKLFHRVFSDFWGLSYLELKNMYPIALYILSRYQ